MKLEINQACNQIMEESRMIRLPGHVPQLTDVGMWKLKSEYMCDQGQTSVKLLFCPMAYRFGCDCQIKKIDGPFYTALQMRGEHNADSHAPEKERSKHLTVKHIHAIASLIRNWRPHGS